MNSMTLLVVAILVSYVPTNGWHSNSIGPPCSKQWRRMWQHVKSANALKMTHCHQQVFCNLFRFRVKFGMTLRWILLLVFPPQLAKLQFWLLLTDWVNRLISWLWRTHIPLKWWLKFSLLALSSSMTCLSLLWVIGTPCLSVIFGKNFLNCPAPNWRWVQLTIHKLTDKRRSSIAALSNIYVALLTNNPVSGIHFYLGLNFGTTPPIMPQQVWPHSRLSMEDHHQRFLSTMKDFVQNTKLTRT